MLRGFYYRLNEVTSKVSKEDLYSALKKDVLHYVSLLKSEYSSDVKFQPDLSEENVNTVLGLLSILCDSVYSSDLDLENMDLRKNLHYNLHKSSLYSKFEHSPAIVSEYSGQNICLCDVICDCFFGYINKHFCSFEIDFPIVRTFEDVKEAMSDYGFRYFEMSGEYTTDGKPDSCFYSLTPSGDRHYVITVPYGLDGYHTALEILPNLKGYNRYICNSLVCWDKLFPRDYTGVESVLDDFFGRVSKPTIIYRCNIPQ